MRQKNNLIQPHAPAKTAEFVNGDAIWAWGCDFSVLVVNRKITLLFYDIRVGGDFMKKFLIAICSVVLAFGLTGCWGKGKAPVGKGKAPVVQTRG